MFWGQTDAYCPTNFVSRATITMAYLACALQVLGAKRAGPEVEGV